MTILKTKRSRPESTERRRQRNAIRALLKRAVRGNAHAFAQAASHYTDLISEYLYLCGYSCPQTRLFHIQQILTHCWKYLPYVRRVSDFERFLMVQLENYDKTSSPLLYGPHAYLNELNHMQRFLLVARIFEKWSLKSLRLALRCGSKDLSKALMALKCQLVDFKWSRLKEDEQLQVFRVSEQLEGNLSPRALRKVSSEISRYFHAQTFKADWLEYHCLLTELRFGMQLEAQEQDELRERLIDLIRQQPMERPRLSDYLINQIAFVRIPSA